MKIKIILLILINVFMVRSEWNTFISNNYNLEEDSLNISDHNEIKDRKTSNSMQCSEYETEKQQDLFETNNMLKKGEMVIKSRLHIPESTVVVLGNPGVGKTTFVQFMAGSTNKLVSKEVGKDSGQFLIEDGIKIGISMTDSVTLYPEQLEVTSNYSFTDTPGFCDTRSERHEAVATYTMKKYLMNIRNIKIVLLITYYSVEQGIYKDDFINLLQNLNSFLNDTENYHNSIALIATKVPNTYKVTKNNVTLVPDEKIIANIADYMRQVKISLTEKISKSYKENEKTTLFNVIKIIENLLETDNSGNYRKINIFRRPLTSGLLSEMPVFQEAKKSLLNTITNNIEFKQISSNSIGYMLSPKAILYLNCLLQYINEAVINMSSYIFHEIENHYKTEMSNYTNYYALSEEITKIYDKLNTLKNNLKESQNYTQYSFIISEFVKNENIYIPKLESYPSVDVHDYISNLQQFIKTESVLLPLIWAEQIKSILINLKEALNWNNFLIKTFEYFSSFDIQKNKSTLYNVINLNVTTGDKDKNNDKLELILSNIDKSSLKPFDYNFNLLVLEEEKKLDLKNIVHFTLQEQNSVICNRGKFAIIGNYIKLSSIIDGVDFKKCYEKSNLKSIALYATHKVFIDVNLKDEKFEGVNIMIIAPIWVINDRQVISIDGKTGKQHNILKAQNGKYFGEKGENGKAGLPGANAGNFIGLGLKFINDHNLVIKANGGKGGAGQNGGDGKEGVKGNDGYNENYMPYLDNATEIWEYFIEEQLMKDKVLSRERMKVGSCRGIIETFTREGECGGPGGTGGVGGIGGIGGNAGMINLIGKDGEPKFVKENCSGVSGLPGAKGKDGVKGKNGKTITCFRINMIEMTESIQEFEYILPPLEVEKKFWKCKHLMYKELKCVEDDTKSIDNSSELSLTKVQQSPEPSNYDFSEELNVYMKSLLFKQNNKLLSIQIQEMLNLIYKL